MKKHSFLYRNSLALVVFFFFLVFICGQSYTGWKVYNKEMEEKGGAQIEWTSYLGTAHFVEATFENFESEFLQMTMYVLLTVFLRQRGSAESKSLEEEESVDREPVPHKGAPWPVKKGGIWLKLYSNSLSLALLLLFIISFALHSHASLIEYNKEQILEGEKALTYPEFLGTSQLWFESFQNWQSEFIAVLSIVLLSIFLRQKGSPESKPVDAPHLQTGE
jgi:hypothetical protein